jgi:hypothetical protein
MSDEMRLVLRNIEQNDVSEMDQIINGPAWDRYLKYRILGPILMSISSWIVVSGLGFPEEVLTRLL